MSSTAAVRIGPAGNPYVPEKLLERCRSGELSAQRQFYESHVGFVFSSARRLGLPPSELEDVAQEVFAETFSSLSQLRPDAIKGWLYQLVSHRVHSYHRRRRVRTTFARWFGREQSNPADSAEAIDRHDAQRQLDRLLARMSRPRREVLVLFELEGLSGEEVATRLQLPIKTVWTRLHRARRELVSVASDLGILDELRLLSGERR